LWDVILILFLCNELYFDFCAIFRAFIQELSNFVFDNAPNAQLAVVIIGTITLLFGAIIGTAKDDIKKALAASTMSQIGYMILATGFGPAGYAFAIMHLLTHGFFKAGMFLGAGSVMHGMNDEVNMRRYGGLAKFMPITAITFGLGYLAIIGVPPFAGFYSKDKIIETAFNAGGVQGVIFGSAALLGAVITAFYMTRVMLMTFAGNKRWADDAHPHESILNVGSNGGFSYRISRFGIPALQRKSDCEVVGPCGRQTSP